ncbi:hypothetical protein LTR09_007670 [Extremus antarcticus]|uniref:Uncharacterized protein n=1 Tax=Extremus antarcticus TaxID=702011 RepID=A0AAJ0DJT7_9PEZI|nr:hypothetical protein LTR09_007670 [Extremus antarcticus]
MCRQYWIRCRNTACLTPLTEVKYHGDISFVPGLPILCPNDCTYIPITGPLNWNALASQPMATCARCVAAARLEITKTAATERLRLHQQKTLAPEASGADDVPGGSETAAPAGEVMLTTPRPAWLPASEPLVKLATGQIVPAIWSPLAQLQRGETVPAELRTKSELLPTYEKGLEIDENRSLAWPVVLEDR